MLVKDILDRTRFLKEMHDEALPDRARFRAIINGGEKFLGNNLVELFIKLNSTENRLLTFDNTRLMKFK